MTPAAATDIHAMRRPIDAIVETLDLLCPYAPVEIRILLAGKREPLVRRFDDHAAAAAWVMTYPAARAAYVVMNPYDETSIKGVAVDDAAVTHRCWLLVDTDPERIPKVSNATDAEHDAAIAVSKAIKSYLTARGWPDLVEADSGNGGHLLCPIDLPNDAESLALVSNVLNALASMFDTADVKVDRGNKNAARITKLYGTHARKAPETRDRPHRLSTITHIPDAFATVPLAALQHIAALAPKKPVKPTHTSGPLYDLSRVLARLEINETSTGAAKDGKITTYYHCTCPWVGEHGADAKTGSALIVYADGAVVYKCYHDHCVDRGWPELRDHFAIETEARRQQDQFPATETGDAEAFAALHAALVRYDQRRGRWLLFDGHGWQTPTNGEIERLALGCIRERQRAAVGDKERLKWALQGESRARQTNLLALAQNILPISDSGDGWDVDPWLLGAPNGVINLKNGTLRDGRPEDRITMRVRVAYHPDAVCPLYDKTVKEIFNDDALLISYFDRYIGYSLTGDCREESLAFCWGGGANGKGTLMNTIGWMLGDYADDLPFSTFELHSRGGIPNDIAKIVGKRFVTASETGEATRLNEARVKAMTGRDPITARFLHQEFFTFQPVAKFWLAANKKPVVHDDSLGFWRRIQLIPFTQCFDGKEDKTLKDKLRKEAAGILARAVRGCLAWQRDKLNPPAAVKDATKTYQTDSAPLARFLDACCVVQGGAKVTFGHLFDAYVKWCGSSRERRLGRHEFNDALRARFATDPGDKRNVVFLGVGLVDLFAAEPEN